MALGVMPGTIEMIKNGKMDSYKVQVQDINILGSEDKPRYKVLLSDGAAQIPCMLLTTLNGLVASKQIKENTIIEIKQAKLSDLRGKPIVILVDCAVISQTDVRISAMAGAAAAASSSSSFAASASSASTAAVAPAASSIRTTPLTDISPYVNRWTIKVRVTKKTPIKHFHAKTDGKLFSVELIDGYSTEIRGTFFNDAVDKWFEVLHEGGTYFISGGQVKTANRRYTSINNEWEITFGDRTTVEPAQDDGTILAVKFNFTQLHHLPQVEVGKVVDVLGIVKEENDFAEITTRRGDQLGKRDLVIVDESNTGVQLTLWGEQAKKFSGMKDLPIAVKGAKIGDYGGISLTTSMSATVQLNPKLESADRLSKWWAKNKDTTDINMLTSAGGSGSGGGALTDPRKRKTLAAIEGEGLAHLNDGAGSVFVTKATISRIMVSPQKLTPPAYYACSNMVDGAKGTRACNRKMTFDTSTGTFTCERCSSSGLPCNEGKWRWILNLRVLDHSSAKLVTAFDEEATAIVGQEASSSIGAFITMSGAHADGTEANTDLASSWYDGFRRLEKVTKYFSMRAKVDTYQDEARVRVSVTKVRDIDPLTEAKRLLTVINAVA